MPINALSIGEVFVYLYATLNNRSLTTIGGSEFQDLIQIQILIFTVSSIIMVYNSAVFPKWIDKTRHQRRLAPLKGSYALYSTLLLGICLTVSAGTLLLTATSISSRFPLCYLISLGVWVILFAALILTVVDVIALVRYLL
jgi:hypothetical protein